MTRLVAGADGGRRLDVPPGSRTRPTTDRVREALFSAVEATLGSLAGLAVLDLFAGSGAVGLEARSRGARSVTLVEHDRRAVETIRRNVRALGYGSAVSVAATTVARFLAEPDRARAAPYDLVYADPPYDLPPPAVAAVLVGLADVRWLAPDAVVVLETSTRAAAVAWPGALALERQRRYGETRLSWARWYGPR